MSVCNSKSTKADAYIGRGSRFGNPFSINRWVSREQAIQAFSEWVTTQPELLRLIRRVLPGKSLGCHCAPLPCHGDIIEQIATGAWDSAIHPEPIFVYGSNLAARNGRGAALAAKQYYGAQPGVCRGHTGQAYAIPTKTEALEVRPLEAILEEIEDFKADASRNPHLTYQLTRIGCGLADPDKSREIPIRDAFLDAPENVLLPGTWESQRRPEIARVIVAGSRTCRDYPLLKDKLDHLLGNLVQQGKTIEIVSGGAKGVDTLGERYAVDHRFTLRRMPAEWERFDKAAGGIRNQRMSWYGTHLAAMWDGMSRGTRSMIQMAKQDGLPTRIIHLQ